MDGEERICLTISQKRVIDFLCNRVLKRYSFIGGYDVNECDRYIELVFKVDYDQYGNDSLCSDVRGEIYDVISIYSMFPNDFRVKCDGGHKWLNILYVGIVRMK